MARSYIGCFVAGVNCPRVLWSVGAGHARDMGISEHLGYVTELQCHTGGACTPREVQQTAKIAASERGRTTCHGVGEFLICHRRRDRGQLGAEGTTEAAANLRALHLLHLNTGVREQCAGLLTDAQFAQPSAAVVVSHGRPARPRRRHESTHGMQEVGELVRLASQSQGAFVPAGGFHEQARIVLHDHAHAGAGRRHHVVVALEAADEVLRQRSRGGDGAGVVAGLAAAGLCERHFHLAAGLFEQRDGRLRHGGAEHVHEATHEEGHAGSCRCGCAHAGAS